MSSSARAGAPTSGVNKAIADVTSALIGQIEGELSVMNGFPSEVLKDEWTLKFHGKCDKWCCFRDQGKPDNWANCKDNAAWVLRNLADPIVPDSFNHNLGVLWKEE